MFKLSQFLTIMLAMMPVAAHAIDLDKVQEGDLAFVVDARYDAIVSVTHAIDSLPVYHVAVFHRIGGDNGPLYLIEAHSRRGVSLNPVDSFLVESGKGNVVLGRARNLDVKKSIGNALSYVGLPFDANYMPGTDAFYCSELVQVSFVDHDGNPIYEPIPMNFRDKDGNIPQVWQHHYDKQNLPVPEGLPGSNPGALTRHPATQILRHP